MWLEVDRSTWSVLFQRKPTSERRSRRVLTKGAENKAEAIALYVAGNSFRPLKRAFLPACFSPSSPRLGAARGIEIYTRKTRGAVRTPAWCRPRNTHSDSSSQFTLWQEPKWNFVPGALLFLFLYPDLSVSTHRSSLRRVEIKDPTPVSSHCTISPEISYTAEKFPYSPPSLVNEKKFGTSSNRSCWD